MLSLVIKQSLGVLRFKGSLRLVPGLVLDPNSALTNYSKNKKK